MPLASQASIPDLLQFASPGSREPGVGSFLLPARGDQSVSTSVDLPAAATRLGSSSDRSGSFPPVQPQGVVTASSIAPSPAVRAVESAECRPRRAGAGGTCPGKAASRWRRRPALVTLSSSFGCTRPVWSPSAKDLRTDALRRSIRWIWTATTGRGSSLPERAFGWAGAPDGGCRFRSRIGP